MRTWLVRCQGEGQSEWFRSAGLAAIGAPHDHRDLSAATSFADIRTVLEEIGRLDSAASRGHSARILTDFVLEAQVGDRMILAVPGEPAYQLGRVDGPYRYAQDGPGGRVHLRPVRWENRWIDRAAVSPAAASSLRRPRSVCRLPPEVAEELERLGALGESRSD